MPKISTVPLATFTSQLQFAFDSEMNVNFMKGFDMVFTISYKRNMKKFSCLFIVIMMCLVFTGCSNKVELNWIVPEPYIPSQNTISALNEKLDAMGCECVVNFVGLPNDGELSYSEQVKSYLNSGKKADIIFSGLANSSQFDLYNSSYYRFAKEGIFESLTSYFDTAIGKELFDCFPLIHQKAMTIDNEIYAVNGALTTLSTDNILLVNTGDINYEWNQDQIYTLKQLSKILKTDAFSNRNTSIMIFEQFLSYSHFKNYTEITKCLYISDDNQLIFSLADSEYINYLVQCKQMMDEGILINGDELENECDISADDCIGGYWLANSFNKTLSRAPYIMIPMEKENVVRFSNIGTGIYSRSRNKEEAFNILSLCFINPEINNMLVFGVENQDYYLNEGIPINTDGYERLRIFSFGNRLICYPLFYESENKKNDFELAYQNAVIPDSLGFVFDDSGVKKEVVKTNELIDELLLHLSHSDITTDETPNIINEYMRAIEDNGLYDIIFDLQFQYSQWMKNREG